MQIAQPIKILDDIAFVASVAFTAAITGIITSNDHGLKQNTIVKVASDDTLPAGLSSSVYYYVVAVTTNTFKLAIEKDGLPVSITDTGTGNHAFTVQGAQEPCFTEGFNHIELELFSDNALNDYVVKVVGSQQEDKPNFNAAQSESNRFEYIQTINLEDGSAVDGNDGFTVAGALKKVLEINTNTLRWVGLIVSSYTAGDLTAHIKLAKFNE